MRPRKDLYEQKTAKWMRFSGKIRFEISRKETTLLLATVSKIDLISKAQGSFVEVHKEKPEKQVRI